MSRPGLPTLLPPTARAGRAALGASSEGRLGRALEALPRARRGGPSTPGESSRPLALLLAAGLLSGTSGCSSEPATSPGPERIGRQIYACDDGSEVAMEFLADGLTIELALPEGSHRLNAPTRGLPFVGDRVNVYLSNGGIVVARSEGPSRSCRPNPGRGQTPRPP